MIPLRRLLIVRGGAELPYPEGRACAEVLRATAEGDSSGRWIFYDLGIGAAIKLCCRWSPWCPAACTGRCRIFLVARWRWRSRRPWSASAVCVSGSVISAVMIIPLVATMLADGGAAVPDAGTLWKSHVRYIGTGAVACAGIITVLRGLPAMAAAFTAVVKGLGGDGSTTPDRTDRDVPGWVIGAGVAAVVVAVALIPGLLAGGLSFTQRLAPAAGVAVFGLVFVAVASRIVGLVGVSSQPTSGITLVTLLGMGLVFRQLGLTDDGAKLALLTCGTIVATAASKAGDISQDLKTGQLVGATPAIQQVGQYLGAATACWAVAATLLFLGGVYLPLASMMPIFIGGIARRIADRATPPDGPEGNKAPSVVTTGVLAASGLVAGEGLAGVVVAAMFGGNLVTKPTAPVIGGQLGQLVATLIVLGTVVFLVLAVRDGRSARRGSR